MDNKINIKSLTSAAVGLLLVSSLYAEDVTLNIQEVASFTLQKHRVDFNAQTDKSKTDLAQEYANLSKIYDTYCFV